MPAAAERSGDGSQGKNERARSPVIQQMTARFTGMTTARKYAAREAAIPIACSRLESSVRSQPTSKTVPAERTASAQSMTARRCGRATAKSSGPVKKTIALPIPTSARSFSTSAAGSHSGPISAIK